MAYVEPRSLEILARLWGKLKHKLFLNSSPGPATEKTPYIVEEY